MPTMYDALVVVINVALFVAFGLGVIAGQQR